LKPIKVTFRPSRRGSLLGVFTARVGRREVGFLRLWRSGAVWKRRGLVVEYIFVVPAYRRHGVATLLYEEASHLAWEWYRMPLVSDYSMTAGSTGFWEKQWKLGRARRIFQRNVSRLLPRSFLRLRFMLVTPPPASLA